MYSAQNREKVELQDLEQIKKERDKSINKIYETQSVKETHTSHVNSRTSASLPLKLPFIQLFLI